MAQGVAWTPAHVYLYKFSHEPVQVGFMSLKPDSHLSKKILLFASWIALQKWWKMLFISS